MDLTLFIVFLGMSLTLIALGLFRPEHSELSLIGFVFLFLLSFQILNGSLVYETGKQIDYSYDNGTLTQVNETLLYSPTTQGANLSKSFGFYLAIASFLGFVAVLVGFGKTNWRDP